MTHDPFQTYAMLGAYSGIPAFQPFTQLNYGQYPGGLHPLLHQQLLSSLLGGQINPQLQGISPFQTGQHSLFGGFPQHAYGFQQHPLAALLNPQFALQNPVLQSQLLQNPWIGATLHNPMLNPLIAQTIGMQSPYQLSPYQQQQSPYQQGFPGSALGQTGYPLAPQSWIGQGQLNPLYQQLARAWMGGINPGAGY